MDLLLLIFQVLYWLSGLTCTDENFIAKSGAQRAASAEGVALIAPDTSPSKSSTINSTKTFSEQFRDSQLFCNTTLFHITWCKCATSIKRPRRCYWMLCLGILTNKWCEHIWNDLRCLYRIWWDGWEIIYILLGL